LIRQLDLDFVFFGFFFSFYNFEEDPPSSVSSLSPRLADLDSFSSNDVEEEEEE